MLSLPGWAAAQLEVDARYASYVHQQDADVSVLRKEEAIRLPLELDYAGIAGLSSEVKQRLDRPDPPPSPRPAVWKASPLRRSCSSWRM